MTFPRSKLPRLSTFAIFSTIPDFFTPMQRFIGLRPLLAAILALFCTLPTGFAQLSKHAQIWHFGNHAGLDFSSGVPVKITTSAMDSYEGCSSYCDASGQLLFYSNGGGFLANPANGLRTGYIWNRNNEIMYNMGQTEGGGYSAAQSALVLPKPGSPNRYYQFTMHDAILANRGLSYFEVDMTLNGGLGSVIQANVSVFKPARECLTAVPNTNGQDFWVIIVDDNTHAFVVVPVTAGGVGQPQVQMPLNHPASDGTLVIKASPDGHYLCAGGDLYVFNAATGEVIYASGLAISNYTFSFSPDSRYLYGFESDASANIIRYDLQPAIPVTSTLTTVPVFTFNGLMQLGPDGNIYFIEQLEEDFLEPIPPASLSVIRCPDSDLPQLERAIMKFPTDIDNVGGLFTSLPNFADYIFAKAGEHDTLQRLICLNPIKLQAPQPGAQYKWSTGDTTAQITVQLPGAYTVAVEDECGTTNTTFVVQAGGAEVHITADPITGDTCRALPLTLHAIGNLPATFRWSDGSTADSLVITGFGVYTVKFTNACGVALDTFELLQPRADCCQPLFPNAFTPNGDGVNDRYSAIFDQCDVESIDFLVYDRWGELIFQGYEATQQWDGLNLNGAEAPSDVYVYTLRYQRRDQSEQQFEKGQITLLR